MKSWLSTIVIFLITDVLPPGAAVPGTREYRVSLREPLPLKPRYEVGETLHYRLLRHTTFFKMDGTRFGEHRALAHFTRTRLEDDGRGRIRERFTWKSFCFGQSMVPDKPAAVSYLEEAENFSLTCSVQDENAISKFDFSTLPGTLKGMWFMIMSWDAVTFDGLVRPQDHFPFPDEALIGTEIHGTRGAYDFEFEYPPIVTDSRYSFSGRSGSRVLGVGMIDDIPCAIVEFSGSENVVVMNMEFTPVSIKSLGFEHLWGKTYLSLEDGRILRGELVAPVTQVQDITMPGRNEPEHAEFLAMQRLELELLSRGEFESEVAKALAGEN